MNLLGLSVLVWLPFVVGILLLITRKSAHVGRIAAPATVAFSILPTIALALRLPTTGAARAVEQHDWLPAIGLQYYLAVDGISVVFLLLACVVFLMGIFASQQLLTADNRYYGFVLLLFSGLLGTFTAQNFLHFFLHWELSLIPAFFLVKLYGGPNRAFASTQFFVYTMAGSVAMLIAFLALGMRANTFDLGELATLKTQGFEARTATVIFLLAFAGVAVKVPIWPLHSWLPSTYTEAPTPVTMMLTGVMSKMGVYGLVRLILPIFPKEITDLHRPLLALAVITILYGAWAAFAQRDIKRLFAYSSLSHLGYCFLGVFAAAKAGAVGLENDRAAAINGVILQVLSHGIIAAALFAFVAFLERRSAGLRLIENFGGLRKVNPLLAGLMGIVVFASLGLPGLSGFPAEFLVFKGAFTFAPVACTFAVFGLLATAVYLLTFFGRVFLGPLNERLAGSVDLTMRERIVVIPAILLVFVLGLAPQLVLSLCNPTVTALVRKLPF